MRKTRLIVTHTTITHETLNDYISGRGPIRMGLRIAILQGVMNNVQIESPARDVSSGHL